MVTASFLPSGFQNSDAGGARVLKPNIFIAGRKRMAGECLTEEEFNSINLSNRRALISSNSIAPWPKPEAVMAQSGERFITLREDGKFDVVQGLVVNPEPLETLEAAKKWASNIKPLQRPRVADKPSRPRDSA